MSVIYRYPLEIKDKQTLMIPKGGWYLSVQPYGNGGTPISMWWCLPDPEAEPESVVIRIIGTGNPFEAEWDKLVPLGTVVTYLPHVLTPLVWHVFEEITDV